MNIIHQVLNRFLTLTIALLSSPLTFSLHLYHLTSHRYLSLLPLTSFLLAKSHKNIAFSLKIPDPNPYFRIRIGLKRAFRQNCDLFFVFSPLNLITNVFMPFLASFELIFFEIYVLGDGSGSKCAVLELFFGFQSLAHKGFVTFSLLLVHCVVVKVFSSDYCSVNLRAAFSSTPIT